MLPLIIGTSSIWLADITSRDERDRRILLPYHCFNSLNDPFKGTECTRVFFKDQVVLGTTLLYIAYDDKKGVCGVSNSSSMTLLINRNQWAIYPPISAWLNWCCWGKPTQINPISYYASIFDVSIREWKNRCENHCSSCSGAEKVYYQTCGISHRSV